MCCVVSDFRSSLFKLEWSEVFWVGLDFSSGCLVAGQFGKTAAKFYPGGRRVFGPSFGCFLVLCFALSGFDCRPLEVGQNVETVFPASVFIALSLGPVCLCVGWVGWKC